jgi:ketosteroid isomerase-like protein
MPVTTWQSGCAIGRGKASGLELEGELYHRVTTFRDGKMVRIEYFTDWAGALEAAGLAK